MYLKAIFKSIAWLIIGVFAGLSSLVILFASSAIFSRPINGRIIDDSIIVYLCIALMSGAAADFLLCGHYEIWPRLFVFSLVIILILVIWLVFNPNNANPPTPQAIKSVVDWYIMITIGYCVGLKTVIFYKELQKPGRRFSQL